MAPIIGRVCDIGPESRHGRMRVVACAAFVACALVSSVLLLIASAADHESPPVAQCPDQGAEASYSFHQPIFIGSDGEFDSSNGVVSGNGSSLNPYVIGGWDISTSSKTGIEIRNTAAFFVIRGCHVHGLDSGNIAVFLFNCANGSVDGNLFTGNQGGIVITDSEDITVSNSVFTDSGTYGVNLHSSSRIVLRDNSLSDSGYGSMLVSYCDNGTISGNDCVGRVWNDYDGIHLWGSNDNMITNNTCTDHQRSGIFLGEQCGNNTLYNNSCSGSNSGICIEYSRPNLLAENECSGNFESGIMIWYTDSVTLTGNNCSGNMYGAFLRNSHDNTLTGGVCSGNMEAGVYLLNSNGNAISYGNCSENGYLGGMYIQDSSNNTVSNNSLSGNLGYGVVIVSDFGIASGNRVWGNWFYGNNGADGEYDLAHVQARDAGAGNWWNNTEGRGNYWNDWRGPDLSPMDGIVDYPYLVDGSAGAFDHHPIAEYYGTTVPELGPAFLAVMGVMTIALAIAGRRIGGPR